jgi:hypothetical protein
VSAEASTPDLVMSQRLWAMFGVAILLVAGMNAYAVLREPDVVPIGDLVEHTNEVVRIEGTLTSWMVDPYGTGEDRVDVILEDSTGVVEVRWYRAGALPPVGTVVDATGDVIEWEGRLYMQSLGAGAVSWEAEDLPAVVSTSLSDVALDPANHSEVVLRLSGYIGEAIPPDAAWTSAQLNDHPTWSNAEHHLRLIVSSAPGRWIEHGARIQADGLLRYDPASLQWAFHVSGPDLLVDPSHTPAVEALNWDDTASWSYRSGAIARLSGVLVQDDDGWWMTSGEERACFLPGGDDANAVDAFENSTTTATGRLLWSSTLGSWCLDARTEDDLNLIVPTELADVLGMLNVEPGAVLNDGQRHTVRLYTRYAVAPGVEPASTSLADQPAYSPGWRTVAASLPGPRTTWIEAGQAIVAEVTVEWDAASMRARLTVHSMTHDGPVPNPVPLGWDDGAVQWGYSRDMRVALSGVLDLSDPSLPMLRQAGGQRAVQIAPVDGSLALDDLHANTTLQFVGRLHQMEGEDGTSLTYVLDKADVEDRDGDGLADGLEVALGTDPDNEDSDGNGSNDRVDMEEA